MCVAADGGKSAGAELAAPGGEVGGAREGVPTVRAGAENYTIGSCWPLILR